MKRIYENEHYGIYLDSLHVKHDNSLRKLYLYPLNNVDYLRRNMSGKVRMLTNESVEDIISYALLHKLPSYITRQHSSQITTINE